MDRDDIIRMADEASGGRPADGWGVMLDHQQLERFAALIAAAERKAVLQAIEAVYTLEEDRNPMFSDGYKYALNQIETFIRTRGQE